MNALVTALAFTRHSLSHSSRTHGQFLTHQEQLASIIDWRQQQQSSRAAVVPSVKPSERKESFSAATAAACAASTREALAVVWHPCPCYHLWFRCFHCLCSAPGARTVSVTESFCGQSSFWHCLQYCSSTEAHFQAVSARPGWCSAATPKTHKHHWPIANQLICIQPITW